MEKWPLLAQQRLIRHAATLKTLSKSQTYNVLKGHIFTLPAAVLYIAPHLQVSTSTMVPKLLLILLTFAVACWPVAGDSSDDMANNLFSDLAPYVSPLKSGDFSFVLIVSILISLCMS